MTTTMHTGLCAVVLLLFVAPAAASDVFFVQASVSERTSTSSSAEMLQALLQGAAAPHDTHTVDKLAQRSLSMVGSLNTCPQVTLASLFYWPDGFPTTDPWDRAAMLAKVAEPHGNLVLEVSNKFLEVPEYAFEGIKSFRDAAHADTKILLVMPTEAAAPGIQGGQNFDPPTVLTNQQLAGVVGLLGRNLGVEVVGAGVANQKLGLLTSTAQKKYLVAACLFSHLTGKSATTSTAALPSGVNTEDAESIAAAALETVQGEPEAGELPDYLGGSWFSDSRPRTFRMEKWGTSTEEGIHRQMSATLGLLNQGYTMLGTTAKKADVLAPTWHATDDNPAHMFLRRSVAFGPGPDDYDIQESDLPKYKTWMEFDFQYDKETTALDNGNSAYNVACMDSNYIGSSVQAASHKIIGRRKQGERVNFFPMRLFIARERLANPTNRVYNDDNMHLSYSYLTGVASGMLTLASGGRCYVGPEPADVSTADWDKWHARKTGYELVYEYATLRPRAPCFVVHPSAKDSTITADTELTIGFRTAPTAEVVVEVMVDNTAAANTGASILRFTPTDFEPVKVALDSSGFAAADTPIKITFNTRSADPDFDGLSDWWEFMSGPKATDVTPCNDDGLDGASFSDGTNLGSVAQFTCPSGQKASGGSTSRTCTSSGAWTGTDLECSDDALDAGATPAPTLAGGGDAAADSSTALDAGATPAPTLAGGGDAAADSSTDINGAFSCYSSTPLVPLSVMALALVASCV